MKELAHLIRQEIDRQGMDDGDGAPFCRWPRLNTASRVALVRSPGTISEAVCWTGHDRGFDSLTASPSRGGQRHPGPLADNRETCTHPSLRVLWAS